MKISCFLWVKVQNPKIFHLKSHKNKKSNKTSHLETENSFLLMIAALILISWRQKQFKRWKLKFLSTKNSVSDVTFTACRRSLPAPEDVRSRYEEKTFNMLRDNKLCRAQQRKHFLSGDIFSLGSVFSPPGCRGIPPSTRSVNTRICPITASANEAPAYDQLETLLFFSCVHLELQFSRTRTNVCVWSCRHVSWRWGGTAVITFCRPRL